MNITSILPTISVVSVSNQVLPASGRSPAVARSLISKKSSASTASTSITGVSQLILRFSSRPSAPSLLVREASNLKQSETRNNYIPRFLRNKNNPVGSFLLPGGSERIRTSETLLPTRFRVVRLQPLGHASTSHSITPFS